MWPHTAPVGRKLQIYHPPQVLLGPRPLLKMAGANHGKNDELEAGPMPAEAQRHFKAISVRPSVVLTDQENLKQIA